MVNYIIIVIILIVLIISSIIIGILWQRGILTKKNKDIYIPPGMICDPNNDTCTTGYYCADEGSGIGNICSKQILTSSNELLESKNEPAEEIIGAPVNEAPLESEEQAHIATDESQITTTEPKEAPVKTESAPAKIPTEGFYIGDQWRWEPRLVPSGQTYLGGYERKLSIGPLREKCVNDNRCQGVYGNAYKDPNQHIKPQYRMMSNVGIDSGKTLPLRYYTQDGLSGLGRWTYLPRAWRYDAKVIPKDQRYLGNWIQNDIITGQQKCEQNSECKGMHVAMQDGNLKFRYMRDIGVPSGELMKEKNKYLGVWSYLPRNWKYYPSANPEGQTFLPGGFTNGSIGDAQRQCIANSKCKGIYYGYKFGPDGKPIYQYKKIANFNPISDKTIKNLPDVGLYQKI
jgi:hypothetical protein